MHSIRGIYFWETGLESGICFFGTPCPGHFELQLTERCVRLRSYLSNRRVVFSEFVEGKQCVYLRNYLIDHRVACPNAELLVQHQICLFSRGVAYLVEVGEEV